MQSIDGIKKEIGNQESREGSRVFQTDDRARSGFLMGWRNYI